MTRTTPLAFVAAVLLAIFAATHVHAQTTSPLPFTRTITTMLPRTMNGIAYHPSLQTYFLWGGQSGQFNNSYAAIQERANNNDVWQSTDGLNWVCVSGRYRATVADDWTVCNGRADNGLFLTVGATTCSDAQGGMYVVGGEYSLPDTPRLQTHNNVFYSTDGLTWTLRANTGLPARSYANCVTTSNSVLVMNGNLDYNDVVGDWRNPGNDVWTSALGGAAFTFVRNATYAPRAAAMATSVVDVSVYHYDRIIYVIGGWSDLTNRTLNNDIHYSTDAGRTWTDIRSVGRFSERADASLFSTPRGFLALVGGRTLVGNNEWNFVNDIYLSADGGVSWYLRNGNFSARIFPAVIAAGSKAQMLLAAGAANTWQNDVAVSVLQFDNEPAITMQQFNMKPNRVTSSCFGLFACSNELAFVERNPDSLWSPRSHHGVFIDSRNRLVVFGGMPTADSANVWKSTNNGVTWTQTPSTTMPARTAACAHADINGVMYVTGGWAQGEALELSNRTFASNDGGETWIEATVATSVFASRSWHNCLSDSQGNAYVLNGYGAASALNDVWVSSDNGASWAVATSSAYPPRAGASVAVWLKGTERTVDIVYVAGGTTGFWDLPYDDVYYSTDGLRTWTAITTDAPWAARQDGSLVAAKNGMLVLSGGLQTLSGTRYYFNDVWLSFDGGANWAVVEDAPYEMRAFGVLVTLLDQSLAMVGGYGSVYDNDTLSSFIDYNDVWVTGVKMDQVNSLKNMAEWTVPVTCFAPQVLCSSIIVPSSTGGATGSTGGGGEPSQSSSSSSNAGAVAGGVIGALAGVAILWVIYSVRVHGRVVVPCWNRGGGGARGSTSWGSKRLVGDDEDTNMSTNSRYSNLS